jgi:hypothetical protein
METVKLIPVMTISRQMSIEKRDDAVFKPSLERDVFTDFTSVFGKE